MKKNYFIGLDIGTESCGWAVTDENYNILRKKGKKLWGVRLFKGAESAEERRSKRCARRTLVRKKLRLEWLMEIFKPEIDKIDDKMLDRIKYSNLYLEDKMLYNNKIQSKDSLFNTQINGKKFTDKDYFEKYPTIYHLRKELTQTPAQDIRFLYLAIHNIIKKRGHFLYDGELESNENLFKLIQNLFSKLNSSENVFNTSINLSCVIDSIEDELVSILLDKKGVRTTKQDFCKLFNANSKSEKSIINSFVDGKINLKDIFDIDSDNDFKLDFQSETYLEEFSKISQELSEEQEDIVSILNQIFSTLQLRKIIGKHNYICESMVENFDLHNAQLKSFKAFIKEYYPEKYNDIFRLSQKEGKNINYAVYVNGSIYNGEKRIVNITNTQRTKDEFYKFIKNILKTPKFEDEQYLKSRQEILDLIDGDNFLNKQKTKENSILPNKLYKKELQKILEVNSEKFPFLNRKDDTGLTNAEKIIQILTFRIPYFVGPLGGDGESKTSWIKRDKSYDIKPWNLEKMIDFDQAEENFINKMTNKCTYLKDEDVLPKNSILFQKFKVLNDLNNLKINGNPLSVKLKQDIYSQLFANNKKVTVKMLKDFLLANNYYSRSDIENMTIQGIDKEFVNNCSSYVNFVKFFGKSFVDENLNIFEKIIKYHTIIEDKNRLYSRVKREFGEILNEEQLKFIKSGNYKGWGSLSEKFLKDLKFVDKETGEITTIINSLWETNFNLQQIIFNTNYTLQKELEKNSQKLCDEITYEQVEQLYCSPAVKRGVWQSLKILKEIISAMGCPPEKIFVEVTREDGEKGDKGRTLSRHDNLLKFYNSKEFKREVEKQSIELDQLFNELNEKDNMSLRSEKLYLYFLQLGRCMYSGERIDIKDIYDENLYDVDHIVPQAKLKDDSINNKVLVKKVLNNIKSDNYPLSQALNISSQVKDFWKLLYDLNLIKKEKYSKLIRNDDLSEDELGGFIAKQLVETNQTNKAVIDLLKQYLGDKTKIVYSKAKFVSDFRNSYDIYKSRLVNDLHHSKDAYLNIVVGNVLNSRFTDDPMNFYKVKNKNSNTTKNTTELFKRTVFSPTNSSVIWNGINDVVRIKEIVLKDDCIVTKMPFCDYNGSFYDETVYKKSDNDELISLKGNNSPLADTSKYGGYNKLRNAYFTVVESEKKGEKITTIEAVPILIIQKYKDSENLQEKILEYLSEKNKLTNAKIKIPVLKFHSLLKIDNGYYWFGGKTGSRYVLHNANQWKVSQNIVKYVKAIEKYIELLNAKKVDSLEEVKGKVIVAKASKKGNKEIVLTYEENIMLYDEIINQLNKKIYLNSPFENVKDVMVSTKDKFLALNVLKQAECLYKILRRVSTGTMAADMTLLGAAQSVGVISLNKNVTDKNIFLIKQSPAGLVEKIVRF